VPRSERRGGGGVAFLQRLRSPGKVLRHLSFIGKANSWLIKKRKLTWHYRVWEEDNASSTAEEEGRREMESLYFLKAKHPRVALA